MKQLLQNILSVLTAKEKKAFVKGILLDILISFLDILFLVLLLAVINFYTQPHSVKYTTVLFTVFEKHPLWLIGIFFILFSVKNAFGFGVFRSQYQYVYAVASRISKEKLTGYYHCPFSDYVKVDSAVTIRMISQLPIEFSHYVLRGVQQIISQVVLIILTLIPAIIFKPVLFPILFLVLAPPVLLLGITMKKKLIRARASVKSSGEQSLQHLKEAIAGYVESNVYGKNDFFIKRYHTFQAKVNQHLSRQQILQNLPSRFIEVFAIFGLVVLIVINAFTPGSGAVSLVTIGAFMAAAYKIIPGIVKILNSSAQIKTYSYTIAALLPQNSPVLKKEKLSAITSIGFDSVFFSYEDKNVLEGFSMRAEKGDCIGISGSSGKGKTTLINLLLGFLSPASGTISINGTATTQGDRQQYWDKIAYVKQEHFLIHDTILKNITLREEGQADKKLMEITALTGVDEMVRTIPGGLHALISEEGKNFSGGQRQRILLARALYKDFDLLILDEPFNELDETSEIILLEHLQKIAGEGKIILLITHHATGLSFCNKKVVLDA